ncbi:hypothetical protein NP233_g9407 [Leucocoprinus birnbaumii]|uniref:Uncharacterized protein n=1 Tax=Leucocoprinus birnbaumii TaxID=56174 RepID=A0AAD5VMT0_9AGAR|nr:hypothetical protein NP233_g9407 [Leucocoprinus birnbaumii]
MQNSSALNTSFQKRFDPVGEKKYWHSHKYEIESGLLQLQAKGVIPGAVVNIAEQPAMLELHKTYGKTIHTWAVDISPDLPLGPPSLMASYTSDEQVPVTMVAERDSRLGVSTEAQKKHRQGYLPVFEKHREADEWEKSGKGIQFIADEVELAAGDTVVVVVSTDPLGVNPPTTQTIQTLPAVPGAAVPTTNTNTATTQQTATTATTTTTPAAAPIAQGPVAEPAPTPQGAGGATPYTYTTIINGVASVVVDNFTPTNPATTPVTATGTGTVWDFSQYMSVYGGPQATAGSNSASQNKAFGGLTMMTCLITILIL